MTSRRAYNAATVLTISLSTVGCSGEILTGPMMSAHGRGTAVLGASWQTATPMLEASSTVSGAAIGGLIYAVTGNSPHLGERQTTQVFDPSSGTWRSRRAMNAPRHGFAAAELDGRIYVATGWDGGSMRSELEAYDPVTDSWTSLSPIRNPRRLGAAAGAGGLLYVIGGCGYSGPCTVVESYDPATNRWTTRPPMPTDRAYHGAGTIAGIVYVVGGFDFGAGSTPTGTLEAFDPISNQWSAKASMPTPRVGAMVQTVDDRLYVISGQDGFGNWLNVVEVYDPATDTWTTASPIPTGRQFGGSAYLNASLHVFGGYGKNGSTSVHEVLFLTPTRVEQCKNDGWRAWGFRNQGQCVRFVKTGKR